jgi:histidyl-tRNA synthetase
VSKKNKVKPAKLKGFQDYSTDIMTKRYEIMDTVRETARISGFNMMETPALEYAEVLLGEGGETDKQVYKFEDNGGREVAMRFDLTVPFARFAAENYGKYPLPYKRAQIGNVWRAEKPQKGRYREFAQCDFDIIGVDSKFADLEVVQALGGTLSKIDVGKFTVSFGHRFILSGLIEVFLPKILEQETGETEALIAIDKLDKIGPAKVASLLGQIEGATVEGSERLMSFIGETASSDLLDKILGLFGDNDRARTAVETTKFIVDQLNAYLETLGGFGKAVIDLKIARGLAYYTGIVFETTLDELPGFGSVCSGGRYNNLCDRFSSRELPGVGGSIGLDRLVAGLVELEKIGAQKREGIFIAIADEEARLYAISLLSKIRNAGTVCDIDLKGQKLNKQFQVADRLMSSYVIVVGRKELENKDSTTLSVKNLETGEQNEVSLDEILKLH